MTIHSSAAARLLAVFGAVYLGSLSSLAHADAGDQLCFPLYRAIGAIPGTPECPRTAATADVGLGTFACTASSGATIHIPRYCGTPPKELAPCASTANPIAIGTANKWLKEVDALEDTDSPALTRHYNSSAMAHPGRMHGRYWRSGFETSVRLTSAGAAVTRPDGRTIYFTQTSGVYRPDADINDRLTRIPATGTQTGWLYTDAALGTTGQYDFTTLLMTRLTYANGQSYSLTYSTATTPVNVAPAADYLIAVTNHLGRTLNITYDSATRLANKVTLPDGSAITYAYNSDKLLTQATYADATFRKYAYNEAAFNGGTNQPHLLTGIVDENASRYINYLYNAQGQAVAEQLLAQPGSPIGLNTLSYESMVGYNSATQSSSTTGRTVLTDALGSQYAYSFAAIQGVARVIAVSQPGGAGCAAASSAISYDANGNKASEDDFNGKRVCYVHDPARNLPSVRVEGLANTASCTSVTAANAALPTGSRKVSTQWHPDWRLPTRVAEPGRITTYVYNGQSDPTSGNAVAACAPATAVLPDGKPISVLCKQVQQATTDVNGSLGLSAALQTGVPARTTSRSYNAVGQVLTEKDAQGRTMSHAYYADTTASHNVGDKQSTTQPNGQVTSYGQYNRLGQLLQSVDANGVVTQHVYDTRQRLVSSTVNGQTTSYSYDAVGQLKRITQANGQWIGFEYDGAHRQTAVSDKRGNRIQYSLDNAGNRTGQSAKDPAGSLQRNVVQSLDALSRVQQSSAQP
jgi:YD repeat-containing protein